ncbi:CBS domain-containing protein [Streptomyces sp. NPDC050534]|uniref:CBS domain-containing protein n=1 Tax=Streptomyces sp. NPDC050534 TaxID=3365625 RepID=UPI00379DE633
MSSSLSAGSRSRTSASDHATDHPPAQTAGPAAASAEPDPADRTPLGEPAAVPVTAHPDETLRTLANRMAHHEVTRLLVVGREEDRVEGIISLRDLLTARRIDHHEEHHAERVLTLRTRGAIRMPGTTIAKAKKISV